MAAKGSMNSNIDAHALEVIIVAAGTLKRECESIANDIRTICTSMTTDDTLVGGDAEDIKASFEAIAAGVTKMEKSLKGIVDVLNNNLSAALNLSGGKTTGDIKEETAKAAKKAGVFAKE